MDKNIEQLLQLAKNPHYMMSEKESKLLEEYRSKNKNVKNKNVVNRHSTKTDKHDVDMDTVQPKHETL